MKIMCEPSGGFVPASGSRRLKDQSTAEVQNRFGTHMFNAADRVGTSPVPVTSCGSVTLYDAKRTPVRNIGGDDRPLQRSIAAT
ncbi:hypothetical protein [Azospirillum brasilense]|uniref:hypothetical protein n=1 Tax=Azospirillum brasilense TaxID=192 RepID=UPI0013B45DDB|nr:hypothetical protein [Azospirillum brasilense]